MVKKNMIKTWIKHLGRLLDFSVSRAFNICQIYQYFTVYRWYFFLKFEHFS